MFVSTCVCFIERQINPDKHLIVLAHIHLHLQIHSAIRFIDYCHRCGDEEKVRDDLNRRYYPSSSSRASQSLASVFYFKNLIPGLEAVVSDNLEAVLNSKYRKKKGHCLDGKTVGVITTMDVTTPAEAKQC